eukprot:TRINITY_DN2660_c0_g1_i1.p1 TRINITY_DN2660_c0_g1~~TRINITY_DN2660_c0_g1_i1.p1  ORF type:complete len:127 (+),score=24.05 TRINITY_DN2660_c0_g1_i1:85-465(+)
MYYRNAHIAVVVYDITKKETFEAAKTWMNELKDATRNDITLALVGNKIDIEVSREVQTSDAEELANANNCLYMETSAKTNHNINELFMKIIEKLPLDTIYKEREENTLRKKKDFVLRDDKKRKCNC